VTTPAPEGPRQTGTSETAPAVPTPARLAPSAPTAAPAPEDGLVRVEAAEAAQHRLFAFTLERVVFFSDAVFAIAITLLAIELRLPELPGRVTDQDLVQAIRDLAPALFAFVISFAVTAAFWIGHYRTFRYIVDVDGWLITINLVFLFCIALLPFPTSVIATYGDTTTAAVIYATFGVATGLASTLLWIYPSRIGHLVSVEVTPEIARYVGYRALIIPLVFAISIPVAFVSPAAAWLCWILAAPVQTLATRRLHMRGSYGMHAPPPS
jgi:uncharacterized membrane protein